MNNPKLNQNLKHLLKYGTSAIEIKDINTLHELFYFKAIFKLPNARTNENSIVIRLSTKKGSKSKINSYLKHGKVLLI